MKSYATFFIIAVQTLGLGFLLVTRDRSKHDAPAEVPELKESTSADAGADAEAGARPANADAAIAMSDAGSGEKPLRVVSLGWELVAPGAAITPAAGGPPQAPAPPIELAPETSLDAVEGRLARGGADPQGADIAVLPLPAFVASFERLRALEPKVFLVVGFSHGREEVHAASGALLKAPPPADEVKVVALGPQTASDASARAAGSESATLLGLFSLDLLGVAPSRVRFVAPGTPEAKTALLGAIVNGATDERKLAFTSAEASRLVPIVAVAPKAVIDARERALREWSKAWLDGLTRSTSDVPNLARRLAAKEALPLAAGVGGAPEALVLVARLGKIDSVKLDQQTSFVGPLAKGPVTLDTLTQRTWQLERGAGIVTSAAPDPLPIDARVVSMIGTPPKDTTLPAPEGDAGAAFGPIPTGAIPLVAYRAASGDADAVATQIHFLAGIFERHAFRISAKGGAKAALAIATAAREKGVAASRLATAAGEPPGAFASVEVLSPP
jgi:hypothetical protein